MAIHPIVDETQNVNFMVVVQGKVRKTPLGFILWGP